MSILGSPGGGRVGSSGADMSRILVPVQTGFLLPAGAGRADSRTGIRRQAAGEKVPFFPMFEPQLPDVRPCGSNRRNPLTEWAVLLLNGVGGAGSLRAPFGCRLQDSLGI